MSVSNNKDNIDWNNVLKKEVIGTDGLDLGELIEVGENFFITQKGLLNKKKFIIPISTAESFDGDVLKVKVNESELAGYEETTEPKFKDYPSFKSSDMTHEMETTIPVIGENLQVSKKVVEDKVDIIKDPVKETKTVEIELTYEKVTIERKAFDNNNRSQDPLVQSNQDGLSDIEKPVSTKTQISIPLKREVPVIIKNPYIREEVIIKKKPVKQTKVITEDVTNEEITYEEKKIHSDT